MNKKIIWILVFLTFAVLATAECPTEPADCTSQDFNNPEFYKDPNFIGTNPHQWNWEYVDTNDPQIYNNPSIQVELSANPDAINRYFEQHGCSGCRAFNSGHFEFTPTGLQHTNGDIISLGNYPPKTYFADDAEGFSAEWSESAPLEVPATDTIAIDTKGKDIPLKDFPETTVNGNISFKNGQAYIQPGNGVMINGVWIYPSALTGKQKEVLLFFDGLSHPGTNGDYVSINPAEKKLVVSADDEEGGIGLDFLSNNPFFNMYKDTDKVSLFAAYNTEMYYVAPSTPTGSPTVKVRETNEDRLVYSVTNGPFSFWKNYDSSIAGQANEIFAGLDPNLKLTTTPMLINPIDSSDNPIVSAYANGKQVNLTSISIDAFNRAFFITDNGSMPFNYDLYLQQGLQPGQTLPPLEINGRHTETIQVGDSKVTITSKTYSEKELRDLIQNNPDYKIISGVPANKIDILKQFIEELPEDMLNSFSGISIQPQPVYTYRSVKETPKLSYFNTGALSKEGGIITAPDTSLWCEECSDEETFARISSLFTHEIGHEFVARKRIEEGLRGDEPSSTFDKEWETLYGKTTPPPYGKLTKPENPLTVSLKWIPSIDLYSYEPYDSFLNAYANTNNDEYKAVAFETFNSNAAWVISTFLDPSSKFYDARYLKQIELLCKEGGIKAANCQAYGVPYK